MSKDGLDLDNAEGADNAKGAGVVNLAAGSLVQHYSAGQRRRVATSLYSPVQGSGHSEEWWGALGTWYHYLWYPACCFRPGIGWARAESEGKPQLTFILLRAAPAPASSPSAKR